MREDGFNPHDIFEDLKKNDLDPSIFETIDEREFHKAPNFLDFAISPQFLNTLILPKQIEIGTKLFCEYCPDCSNPGYIDILFDQTIGNIKDNIVFLEHGVCPKCSITKFQLIAEKKLLFRNEMVGVAGQRCMPKDALVFTDRGIISLQETNVGDKLSHGPVLEAIDSGNLQEIRLKTKYNYTLRGAQESHVLAYLDPDTSDIKFKKMNEFEIGDMALLYSPGLWPEEYTLLPTSEICTPPLGSFIGYLLSDTNIEYTYRIDRSIVGIVQSKSFLKNIIPSLDAEYKSIPPCILKSPKDVQSEFLYGLLGSRWLELSNGKAHLEEDILYESYSKTLVKQLRVILINFGFITSCVKKDDGRYVMYSVDFLTELRNTNPKLVSILQEGYYPVPIESIEESTELVPMMDVVIPDTNSYTADCHYVHNSGKTKLVGLVATYVNHLFLKIPSPVRFFNQTTGDMLMGTFSGLTLDQSYRNLWKSFKGFMDGSPWFQTYHRFLKKEEKRLGVELLHELKTSILYSHKHLMWNTTGSQDRKMRGDTRIFGAIDELGWMISDSEKQDLQNMNADAVYTSLTNSLTTMRTKYRHVFGPDNFDIPPMIMANISSPSSAKDKIMRLEKDSKKNTRIFAFKAPTWEMNPDYTYETLRDEFSHMDDITFMRDFGAEPPLAANPFLSESRLIDKIATGPEFQGFKVSPYIDKDFMNDSFKAARVSIIKGDKLVPRMLAFDLGFKKNALAVCMFSLNADSQPRLDFALSLKPKKDLRINIVEVFENFTLPIVDSFKVKHVVFDRWQSLDQVERLKDKGVNAQIHSLTYKEMDSVRGSIFSQSVVIPKLEQSMDDYVRDYIDNDRDSTNDVANLGIQLLTVRDMGHRMSKPLLGDDDLFRAFCLGVVKLSDPTVKLEYLEGPVELNSGHKVSFLGTIRSRAAGLGGSSSSSGMIECENGRVLGGVKGRGRR